MHHYFTIKTLHFILLVYTMQEKRMEPMNQNHKNSAYIEFFAKRLYGSEYYYPASPDALTVCKLINKPTLTLEHLRICKEAGWDVKQKTVIQQQKQVEI